MELYQRQEKLVPANFPKDVPQVRVIQFESTTSLSATILPWPTGIALPSHPRWANQDKNDVVVFIPGAKASWDGFNIQVWDDGMHFVVAGATYSITTGALPTTSASTTGPVVPSSSVPGSSASEQPNLVSTPTSRPASAAESAPVSAVPSNTAPATPPPENQTARSGLSGGAVAGVALGCLVAGALIAGLFLWVCLSRRRRTHDRRSETSAMALISPDKGALTHTRSLGGGSPPFSGADATLPQPLEDRAVSGETSKIGNLIKNHVQSYYHSKPVTPGLMDHDDLTALGRGLPISAGTLSTLLDNTGTREIALRFCIAWAIIERVQNCGDSSASLLPPELCGPLREISSIDTANKAHTLKVAHWRVTTAELMGSKYVQDPFTASDSRNVAILCLAQISENILQPFSDSRFNNEERKRNLEEILKRSALFAFTILSQPSSWDFDWKEKQGPASGELCIFPALVQVISEAGERVRPPRSFSEAVIRRLEG